MEANKYKRLLGKKRAMRRRKKIEGTAERPRLTVFRSARHIYSQLINDVGQCTLCAVSSLNKDVKAGLKEKANKKDVAATVGTVMGARAKDLGIQRVYFDVGPYKFHGRVKILAEAFLKSGVRF